ncbi:malonyl-ACP O-methyltransferase BioC [Lysobacter sp. N42]|uniref:malonyl-ACP O-methyltransferase BioC n=1 Tax=Lysobacter sp. N42 TaxID=2545719 RepID=UPI00104DBB79|nr:malonyl-ACP O-methyltransferase BioC [Lysobacter sp. N42]TCZ79616.1 malonyl-[acyl-carrier protein] O-methyltransferase BioC [Lysobacter sp. N42]
MSGLFDHRQVGRAFSRAATHYDEAAALQREVGERLAESLGYYEDKALGARTPQVVLDVGCGTGHGTALLQARWPKARVVGLDLAPGMAQEARRRLGTRRGLLDFARRPAIVCADAAALPLREGSVDVLFSNLCLQWIDDLPAVFAGFRRVLKPDGLLLVSTFGAQTLVELREAFAQADEAPHVSPFIDIAGFGDALVAAGFRDPVLERDVFRESHPDLASVMRGLRLLGATNAASTRRRALTGRARFARASAAYEAMRGADGRLPVTWEVIYAQAWGPAPGAPIRMGGVDEVRVPVSQIPIRRRP